MTIETGPNATCPSNPLRIHQLAPNGVCIWCGTQTAIEQEVTL